MDSTSSSVKRDPLKARAPNFTPRDETILVTLVRKYIDILQSKKTDTSSNNSKIATWQKLELEFNAICGGTYRNSRVLKNKYENIKKRNRRQLAVTKSDGNEITITESEYEQHEEAMELEKRLMEFRKERENMSLTESECQQHAEALEMDKKLTHLRKLKEDLSSAQVRCLLEEHQLKLQHMQEKHEKTLMIQERESKLRMQLLEEEHRIRMDVLQSQKNKEKPMNGSF